MQRTWTRRTDKTVNTSVRVPLELLERLERYTAQRNATKSEIIILALEAYLTEKGEDVE